MTLQELVSRVADWVPRSVKVALRGSEASPSRFANAAHTILDRFARERYPVLPCAGVLKGYRMRIDWEIHRSFVYGSWEPEVVDAVRQHVRPGMTVLDIGAQSGFYTLLLSRLVGPGGKVIAFEPLPANFRLLEENLQLNTLENAVVRKEAVSARSGDLTFEFPRYHRTLVAGPIAPEDELGSFTVPAITLDDFVRETGLPVHFIKMDVEGAETDVMRGARKLLRDWHPLLMIELHHLDACGGRHDLIPLAEEMGYRIEWIGPVNDTAHILARWQPGG
jgi:FkbM family methyltransferase